MHFCKGNIANSIDVREDETKPVSAFEEFKQK